MNPRPLRGKQGGNAVRRSERVLSTGQVTMPSRLCLLHIAVLGRTGSADTFKEDDRSPVDAYAQHRS